MKEEEKAMKLKGIEKAIKRLRWKMFFISINLFDRKRYCKISDLLSRIYALRKEAKLTTCTPCPQLRYRYISEAKGTIIGQEQVKDLEDRLDDMEGFLKKKNLYKEFKSSERKEENTDDNRHEGTGEAGEKGREGAVAS